MLGHGYLNILEDLWIEAVQLVVTESECLQLAQLEEESRSQGPQVVLRKGEDSQVGQVLERPGAHRLDGVSVQVKLLEIHQSSEVVVQHLVEPI